MEKTEVCVGEKVIKLREECELLSTFLIIQGSRPELVPKLEETIGEYGCHTPFALLMALSISISNVGIC